MTHRTGIAGWLGVSFVDENNGVVVGGAILRTTNGGTTWVPETSGTESSLVDISFPDTGHATAVGEDGTILRWTDGGGG